MLGTSPSLEVKTETHDHTSSNEDTARPEMKRSYHTRSREASITESPILQSTHKKFMYVLSAGEREQIAAAEAWSFYGYSPSQPNRREVIINDNKDDTRILDKVKPEDTLYIHSHMYVNTKEIGGYTQSKAKNKNTPREEKTYTPEQLINHLEMKGLNKNHRKLKIFCCYSDSIAHDLYKALVDKGYSQIELSTYKNETTLVSGTMHKAAGLTLEEADKLKGNYKDGSGVIRYFHPEQILGEQHRANIDTNRVKITPESYNQHLSEQARTRSLRP